MAIMGVEDKLAWGGGGRVWHDGCYQGIIFFFNNSFNFSMKFRKVIIKTLMNTSVARDQP